ncbi:uncharacterized protein MICPUCDRAFT_69121 [Micromonas pusilla CCMP1545]|uniref:Predicted protein n=1 Tax=Micromonas pusilla (strain CCMP1545) TaxID=564608 RepID=C1MXK8_MICPC|nr:uncharacterized protein MICPUCDRAFT_69121 [Micromonas pusilla CCMP1545]EEH55183.1 predicted protein [Micromonas pusilla CCMP1545]|eukprot:XP_003060414.1 predicted protein [Micromonas pusilla CCMP1545]
MASAGIALAENARGARGGLTGRDSKTGQFFLLLEPPGAERAIWPNERRDLRRAREVTRSRASHARRPRPDALEGRAVVVRLSIARRTRDRSRRDSDVVDAKTRRGARDRGGREDFRVTTAAEGRRRAGRDARWRGATDRGARGAASDVHRVRAARDDAVRDAPRRDALSNPPRGDAMDGRARVRVVPDDGVRDRRLATALRGGGGRGREDDRRVGRRGRAAPRARPRGGGAPPARAHGGRAQGGARGGRARDASTPRAVGWDRRLDDAGATRARRRGAATARVAVRGEQHEAEAAAEDEQAQASEAAEAG